MLTTTTRNSGEQTTSLTNTEISALLVEWVIDELKLTRNNVDYMVEGDDCIIFFYDSIT